MPMLPKSLPVVRQIRMLATRTRLEQGSHHTNNAFLQAGSWYQEWPKREENFAAAQIHRQKQPIRTVSNRPVSLVDLGTFRPVTMPDQAYVPALPNRNNMAAAQNNSKGRTIRASEQMERRMDYVQRRRGMMMDADRDEAETDTDDQMSQQEHKMDRRPEMRMDAEQDLESDMEVRSVREAVFGPPDDNDEDARLRAEADADLLRRVTAQKVEESPSPTISRKVIQPYISYRNHRTRWAEFRHSMIYGRSAF
ncbi:hypothetical protein KR054_002835 [Drosophila jambulina]|nr:hypothetical protein KR054_002835 [Drosophila jambulina]